MVKGWKQEEIGTIGTVVTGKTPSTKNNAFWDGEIPFITPPDLRCNSVREAQRTITGTGLAQLTPIPRNAVMVCCIGSIGLTGLCGVDRAATNQQINSVIVDASRADPHFLQYGLMHNRPVLQGAARITTVPILNKSNFSRVRMWFPPLAEQRQIARLLSAAQRAIERQERLIALTAELKKALMNHLFTRGTRGEPLKQTEIGPVPESWTECRLGNIARFSSGGTPSREVKEFWQDGVIPWVKTTEINYSTITATEEKITPAGLKNSSAKVFPAGTLLTAMYGQGVTRGRVGILGIEAATNQACAAIAPISPNEVLTGFLYYFLEFHYEHLRRRGHGANQMNLSMTLLKQFPIFYPTIGDQQMIFKALGAVDAEIATHKRAGETYSALFRTLLHQLMTAQIRVHDLDLSALDAAAEPAAEVLEVA